jgi:tetratricopeptide (TPR) repeat protein
MAGIAPGEAENIAQQKVDELMVHLPGEDQDRMSAVFSSLLGFSTELEGEAFKDALLDSLPDFLRQRFAKAPGILVMDDIHWSDSASIELLLHLLPLANELPLLLICVIRPDQEVSGWRVKSAIEAMGDQKGSVITLHPLSVGDSNTLIDELLEISDLPESLRAQILEKSSGNPFFVEEVVRALIDRGLVLQEKGGDRWIATSDESIDIPGNIQALLTARIDRLAEEVRHTLQLASVIGRSFYQRVLEHVAQADVALAGGNGQVIEEHLSTLQGQQMILEAARVPERHYMFRHALTQEAAYKTILRSRRQAYHLRTGTALEKFYAGDLDEHVATLAHHFWAAGDKDSAFRYLVLAGSRSFRLYALEEAKAHYDHAMEIARQTQGVDQVLRLELCTQRGRTLELMGQHEQALNHYQEMQALVEESEDSQTILASLTAQATLYNTPSAVMDAAKGEEAANAGQQLAREIGDWEAAANLLWTMMLGATWMTDEPYKAIEYGEESLALAHEHGLERQMAYSAIDLAPNYVSVGRTDEALRSMLDAQARFEKLDDRPLLAQTYRLIGNLHFMQGRLADAEVELKHSLQIEESIENRWGVAAQKHLLANLDFERGNIGFAVERLEWALEEAIDLGLGPMTLHVTSNLALAYGLVGDWQAGLEILQRAHDHPTLEDMYPAWSWSVHTLLLLGQGDLTAAEKTNEISQIDFDPQRPLFGGIVFAPITIRLANIGVSLATGNLDTALTDVDELLDYLARVKVPLYRPEALYIKGRVLQQEQRLSEARQIWKQALTESEAMGERRMRWQILAGLAEVADDEEEMAGLRASAQEIITYIADHAGRPEHKQSFLDRPEVQRLLQISEEPAQTQGI